MTKWCVLNNSTAPISIFPFFHAYILTQTRTLSFNDDMMCASLLTVSYVCFLFNFHLLVTYKKYLVYANFSLSHHVFVLLSQNVYVYFPFSLYINVFATLSLC